MPAQSTDVVAREIRIKASPETIFGFFTDPEKMTRWKGVTASLDPVPGGEFHVDITEQAVAVGTYLEIDPPHRIVFTWGWEGSEGVPPGSSTVEITLMPDGDETIVALVHRDLPEGAGKEHAEGWDHYLPRLAIAAAGGDPGPDQQVGATEGGM